jgi:hypothetical protein
MPLHERAAYLVLCSRVGCNHAHPLHQLTDSVILVAALPHWVLRGERLLYFEGFHGFPRKELIKIEFLFD